jgi:NAD(P)-dependent dehydrogenase (short-subunit alcohol dehydrogenase family)
MTNPEGRLGGKVAIITGAASGIGRATVDLFAAAGAQVIATDIAPLVDSADASLSLHHDTSDEAQWLSVFQDVQERYGRVDILVNNAGISASVPLPLSEVSFDDWRRVLAVNLDGVFLGMKHAMKAMAGRGGAIVNVSSVHGLVAAPNTAAYSASKGGVTMLTKVGAVEGARLTPPVRVNSIHPGYVDTPLVAARFAQHPDRRARVEQATPLGRLAAPREIASAILYLASDEAGYVTGSAMLVDGGYTAL